MRSATRLFVLCFIAACATGYQPMGFKGGYSDTQLGDNVFQVSFRGNGYTSRERASDFALLRCAEVAQAHDYPYFVIISSDEHSKLSTYTTPATSTGSASAAGNSVYGSTTTYGGQTYVITKPRSRNTIVGFKRRPDGFAYESAYVIRSLRAKYGMTPETP